MADVVRQATHRPESSDHYWLSSSKALTLPDLPDRISTVENPFGLMLETEGLTDSLHGLVDSGCTLNYMTARALGKIDMARLRQLGNSNDLDERLQKLNIAGITEMTFTVEGLEGQSFSSEFIVVDDQNMSSRLPCDCLLGRSWILDTDSFKRRTRRSRDSLSTSFLNGLHR